jgi:hypothetical protein
VTPNDPDLSPDSDSLPDALRSAGLFVPRTPVERAIVWLLDYKDPGLSFREFTMVMEMGCSPEETAGALATLRDRQMIYEQEEDHRQADGSYRREVVLRLRPVDEIP